MSNGGYAHLVPDPEIPAQNPYAQPHAQQSAPLAPPQPHSPLHAYGGPHPSYAGPPQPVPAYPVMQQQPMAQGPGAYAPQAPYQQGPQPPMQAQWGQPPPGQAYQPQYPQQQQHAGAHPYYPPNVPVAYAVAQQPYNQHRQMGTPGHLPRGRWSDGIFDCFDSLVICLLSACLLPLRWAQTVHRLGWMGFAKALILYGIPWLVIISFQMVTGAGRNYLWLYIPIVICWIVQVYLGVTYRAKMREQYAIPGSAAEDCLLHTFCRCCAVAQEARHVDRDYAIPI